MRVRGDYKVTGEMRLGDAALCRCLRGDAVEMMED